MNRNENGVGAGNVATFEGARSAAEHDFYRKTPRQRLEWLESAQRIFRIGQKHLAKRTEKSRFAQQRQT